MNTLSHTAASVVEDADLPAVPTSVGVATGEDHRTGWSKGQEMEALDRIIADLPAQSYLRTALEHLRPQMRQDVLVDMPTFLELTNLRSEAGEAIRDREAAIRTRRALSDDVHELEAKKAKVEEELKDLQQNAFRFIRGIQEVQSGHGDLIAMADRLSTVIYGPKTV